MFVYFDERPPIKAGVRFENEERYFDVSADADDISIDAWIELSTQVGISSYINGLSVCFCISQGPRSQALVGAEEVFYNGLMYNGSIEHLELAILPSNECQMFDLEYFLQNKTNLEELIVRTTGGRLLPEQSIMIANALQSRQLKLLEFECCDNHYDTVLGADGYEIVLPA